MSSVLKVYQDVIEDVISAVREMFLEDGVDEQVLQELKQSWEAKLLASKAVDSQPEEKQTAKKSSEISNGNGFAKTTTVAQQPAQSQGPRQQVGQVAPNNHVQTQLVENKMVPIQITLPAQPGANPPGTNQQARVLTIQVPASALQENQLHKVLTGSLITAMMGLPPNIASSVLQQHVNAAFSQMNQASNVIGQVTTTPTTVIQNDGAADTEPVPSTSKCKVRRKKTVKQIDGPQDTSDEDDEGSDDDEPSDDNDDDNNDDDQEMDEGGGEEEPLNSEDDVTDDEPTDLFDTENVIVCQYDKITRSRNKWKFHLKDGIMNLNGEDYVFQKASGDAEW